MSTTNRTATGSRTPRRVRSLLAGAGLVLTGATLAAVGTSMVPGDATAATVNFVKSVAPDAVSGMLLDEEVVVSFNAAVLGSSIGPDTILVRTGATNGEQARGRYVVGSFMYDKSTQSRVVIRPEAIREYYELIKGLPREDAERATANLIRRMESTGKIKALRDIDQKLNVALGGSSSPASGAKYGTRLDDETVVGTYPSQRIDGNPGDNDDPLTLDDGDDPLEPYRTRIAGDDELWEDYLAGNAGAFADLADNSEYERFYHARDAATGAESPSSVLRQREYRRVLINRRNAKRVMFVPEIPIRADLADTGFTAGRAYSVIIPASQPGVFTTVLTKKDRRPLLQRQGRDFSTLFTTVPGTNPVLFRNSEARTGISTLQKPRVINQTPPNGEAFIDPSTDWEDPDNQFTIPAPQRRTFTIRLRFAQPLDPRTVTPTTFTVTKIASIDASGNEELKNVPVAVGTFLNQHRLGIVEVEITPSTNLDAQSRYQVVARNLVRSLSGAANSTDTITSFVVGAGEPPLTAIRENFTDIANRADPTDEDTLTQVTTAYWNAPPLYDTNSSGKLVAAFMPFAGTGVGAPADPRDPGSPIVTDLALTAGQPISFVTELPDPLDPTIIGSQIEYNYVNVSMQNATAVATGAYPLVIRSQKKIEILSSIINVAGQAGGDGQTNPVVSGEVATSGGPTGGLGGRGGVGGYRGGDGGCAPLTLADGTVDPDANGDFQFDQTKFDGSDGAPGYLFAGTGTGGAGSGGFSNDHDAAPPSPTDCDGPNGIPGDGINALDNGCDPRRVREAGGGGGHATAGQAGAGAARSSRVHPGGHYGGLGGQVYGRADFGDQPRNGLFGGVGVPRLGRGSGGAGGGGGGAEDDSPGSLIGDRIAGHEDSGGGGGGGGGGGIHLVARESILIDSSIVDASGGKGGRTFDAAGSDFGLGAPGGCGAGGSIWLQCYGDITIRNGSNVTAAGGAPDAVNSTRGFYTVDQVGNLVKGLGGRGGDGYVRIEDSDGAAVIPDLQPDSVVGGTHVRGVVTQATFRPFDNPATAVVEADFEVFPGVPFVVNFSQGFSRWFNCQLDTPTFSPHDDDPLTAAIDGTSVSSPAGSQVDIWVRTAPNDAARPGRPNLFLATSAGNTAPWTPYADVASVSDRRFLQFRVDFTVPLSYDFNLANLPYVDYLQIDIDLN